MTKNGKIHNMGLFSKSSNVTGLSLEQIGPIVLEVLKSYDPEVAAAHEDAGEINLLAGTSFWTVIQTVDNYLVGKINSKFYEKLKLFEKQNSPNTTDLPDKPSDTELFNLQFMKFTLNIRKIYSDDVIEEILAKCELPATDMTAVLSPREAVWSFLSNYLVHLLRYELDEAVTDGYGFAKDIEPQLAFLVETFGTYLAYRPEVAKQLPR